MQNTFLSNSFDCIYKWILQEKQRLFIFCQYQQVGYKKCFSAIFRHKSLDAYKNRLFNVIRQNCFELNLVELNTQFPLLSWVYYNIKSRLNDCYNWSCIHCPLPGKCMHQLFLFSVLTILIRKREIWVRKKNVYTSIKSVTQPSWMQYTVTRYNLQKARG